MDIILAQVLTILSAMQDIFSYLTSITLAIIVLLSGFFLLKPNENPTKQEENREIFTVLLLITAQFIILINYWFIIMLIAIGKTIDFNIILCLLEISFISFVLGMSLTTQCGHRLKVTIRMLFFPFGIMASVMLIYWAIYYQQKINLIAWLALTPLLAGTYLLIAGIRESAEYLTAKVPKHT